MKVVAKMIDDNNIINDVTVEVFKDNTCHFCNGTKDCGFRTTLLDDTLENEYFACRLSYYRNNKIEN